MHKTDKEKKGNNNNSFEFLLQPILTSQLKSLVVTGPSNTSVSFFYLNLKRKSRL